jgi:hypothetical protein
LQTGPIELKNPSLRSVAQGSYNTTFVLDNHAYPMRHIARADLVRFDWSGQTVRANIGCATAPFVTSAETSPVITVLLQLASGQATASVDCGGGHDIPLDGSAAAPPKSGDGVIVAVDGILDDASPFTATANAPVL